MAKHFSTEEILQLLVDEEMDSDDDFDGYIDELENVIENMQGIELEPEREYMDGIEQEPEREYMQGVELNDYTTFLQNNEVIDVNTGELDTVDTRSNSIQTANSSTFSTATSDNTNKCPIYFFDLFINGNILQTIVDQTNLCAEQYIAATSQSLGPRSRVHLWSKTRHTTEELSKFIALLILMGIIRYPQLDDYWSKSWPFATTTFSKVMSRDRFSLILKFFHLNDHTMYIRKGLPGYDPLFKIRPLLEPLVENFQNAYNLGRHISIDESMIRFKGRIWFLQYIAKKPHKWGMKAFVVADSKTGYIYNWKLYTGKYFIYKQ